jgi:uncharacterized membrane protein YjgN (DUF898 family)
VEWYYLSGGKQLGPVSAAQLKELAAGGRLQPTDMIWKEGLPQWIAANSVKGLFGGSSSISQRPASSPARGPAAQEEVDPRKAFVFTGTAGGFFKTVLLCWLLSIFTLQIGTPWAVCMYHRWKCDNTFVKGRRLRFDGSGLHLLGKMIVWGFFYIITFTIYIFWIIPKWHRWLYENTNFADS